MRGRRRTFYNHETVDYGMADNGELRRTALTRASFETAKEVNSVLAPIRGNQMGQGRRRGGDMGTLRQKSLSVHYGSTWRGSG